MLSLKRGVVFERISDEIIDALPIINRVYRRHQQDLVITSARDGQHMPGSKHYTGEALDLRTFYFPDHVKEEVLRDLQRDLGSDFDVVLEEDHIHVEYDPP